MGNIYIANATDRNIRMHYKSEKIRLDELRLSFLGKAKLQATVPSGKVSNNSKLEFKRNTNIGFQILPAQEFVDFCNFRCVFVTAYYETENEEEKFDEKNSIMNNLRIYNRLRQPTSFIITKNGAVHLAKNGKIWIDKTGVDNQPK